MTFYSFSPVVENDSVQRAVAFCTANGIDPKAPIHGSTFEVVDAVIITREFVLQGKARVWHEGCCGSTHFAKRQGRYPLVVPPEDFGFDAIRTADGTVAP